MTSAKDQLHILIVGGGVAGLEIATRLGRDAIRSNLYRVTLLDRDSSHIWKPMLHTIAAGTKDIYQQQVSYAAHGSAHGFTYQPGEMCALRRDEKEVDIAPLLLPDGRELLAARTISYDVLVVAVGSQANDFKTPGVRDHCHMIDSRIQANDFNQEVRIRMMQALVDRKDLRICIVGGGATGVELAAELVQLTELAGLYGAAELGSRVKITLLDSGTRLLGVFPEKIAVAAKSKLKALGVNVRNSVRVASADEDGFHLSDGEVVGADLKVWAAGVKAPSFLGNLDRLETLSSNQLVVKNSLNTTRDDAIFALGDCASLTLPGNERPLPPTAQVAHQQASHLIRHLPQFVLHGRQIPDFEFRDLGSLVSLAKYDAYGALGPSKIFQGGSFRGRVAQLGHAFLYRAHQTRLHGFWKGSLIWLIDRLNTRVRPSIRLD